MPGGRIPDKIVEEIRSRIDIVDVISEYIPLTASGKNFKALCPFHDEKTPSFMVSRERQVFKCFGCNAAGDVFTFLMKHQKMTYPEAIKFLADRCGISLSQTSDGEGKALHRLIRELNEFAVGYFHKLLMDSPAGNLPLTYLRKRGIEDNAIEDFKLGFSLPSWDDFFKAAGKAGFSIETMLQGGFILQGKRQDSFYDRFRGRIMFPIFDVKGEPIAFGGRILNEGSSDAKYINSPETPLYSKSKSLYNLNLAHESIRKKGYAILAEGYMDVITCFQAGIHNIIASLGTSLSEGHVKLIKRYTDEVVIAYDSDKAGVAATSRGLDLLVKGDLRVRVLTLPSGKDPDDFVRNSGAESFLDLVSSAVDLLDYKMDRLQYLLDINSIDGKKRAVDIMVATLANMNNQIEKSEYVKRCAERLNVEEGYIWQQLANIGAGRRIERSTQPAIKASPKRSSKEAIERHLIECLIQYPQFIPQARSLLTKEDFSNASHAELIELLWTSNIDEGGIELGDLINRCTSKESRDILSSLILRKNHLPDGSAQFNGCIKKMIEFRKRESKRSILKESAGDSLSAAKRLMELRRMQDPKL